MVRELSLCRVRGPTNVGAIIFECKSPDGPSAGRGVFTGTSESPWVPRPAPLAGRIAIWQRIFLAGQTLAGETIHCVYEEKVLPGPPLAILFSFHSCPFSTLPLSRRNPLLATLFLSRELCR